MKPVFFKDQNDFRKWLEKNHAKEKEVFVALYKVGSGKKNMNWSESVDQALCFGWIDGVTRSLGEESYCIRFTPRKEKSNWSAVNIKKMKVPTEKGLMRPAGLAAFEKRTDKRSEVYTYENEEATLDASLEKKFKANKKAWKFFNSQAPYYKKLWKGRIMSAKQEKTRISRLEKLMEASAAGEKIL